MMKIVRRNGKNNNTAQSRRRAVFVFPQTPLGDGGGAGVCRNNRQTEHLRCVLSKR